MRQLKIGKSITTRDNQSLEKYLQEIGRTELLTPEAEVLLVKRIKQGDQNALDELVKANLRFVVSVAKQYQNQGTSLSDLINEGNLGLIKAAKRFDETRGFKFISYAVWWIRQSILQALVDHARVVKLPANQLQKLNKINTAFTKREQELEREPTVEEIAELAEIDSGDIVFSRGLQHLSLDAELYGEGDNNVQTLLDMLESDENPTDYRASYYESLKTDIERSLGTLSIIEEGVIRLCFGIGEEEPLSLQDTGSTLGLSYERIRQIKDKALKKLRKHKTRKILEEFLSS